MAVGLLGRKVGMTQIFDPTGQVIPVTVIEAGPCHVLQLKTQQQDGYEAVQLGFLNKPRRLASRSVRGHVAKLDSKRQRSRTSAGIAPVAKAGCEPQRFVREFRIPIAGYQVGQVLRVDIFRPTLEDLPAMVAELAKKEGITSTEPGWEEKLKKKVPEKYRQVLASVTAIDVIGTSKGRGTAGVIKRHHFHGQRASHGVKKVHRHAGSIGCNTDPHHVFKGRRMAGHLGAARATIRNVKLVRIDVENNLLLICGSVPGPNGGYVMIRQTNKL